MEVLVFSTSVQSMEQVRSLKTQINLLTSEGKWNFALDDEDRILRIVSNRVEPQLVISLLNQHGFECRELSD
jgi:hypothetical protein